MENLFFHPKVVHLPIALALLMPLIAGGIGVAWWRGWLQRQTWVIAVVLQGVLVVSGIAALRTGEADEEKVEAFVNEARIEAHEEAAQAFVLGGAAVFALMALGLVAIVRDGKSGRASGGRAPLLAGLSLGGTVVVLALGFRAGQAGGSLVYEHGAAQAYQPGNGNVPGALPAGSAEKPTQRDDD